MSSSRKKHKEPKASKKHRHEEKADWPLPHSDGGKVRLTELFGHIEKEFDHLRSENAARELVVNSAPTSPTHPINTLAVPLELAGIAHTLVGHLFVRNGSILTTNHPFGHRPPSK